MIRVRIKNDPELFAENSYLRDRADQYCKEAFAYIAKYQLLKGNIVAQAYCSRIVWPYWKFKDKIIVDTFRNRKAYKGQENVYICYDIGLLSLYMPYCDDECYSGYARIVIYYAESSPHKYTPKYLSTFPLEYNND